MKQKKELFIKDLLIRQKNNDKIFIEEGDQGITFSEIHSKCSLISKEILNKSENLSCPNMGIFLPNSINYAISYLSIAYAERTIVPVEVTLSKLQFISIIDYCEISTILTVTRYLPQLKEYLNGYKINIEIFNIDNMEIINHTGEKRELSERKNDTSSIDDTAIMLHTSGTTSSPKRVMLTHRNLISNVESNILSLKLDENDKSLIVLPMYFGYCNSSQFLTHLYLGASIVIALQPFNPAVFLKTIDAKKCTNTTCIPSMLFLTLAVRKKYDTSSLRYLCFGGGIMPVEKLKQILKYFEGTGIVQTYGQTEASPRVTCLLPKDSLRKIGSVGKAIPNVTVDIFDEHDNPVAVGEKGEIVVRGDNVMKGYYKHPKETEITLRNGWLHTGDIGKFDNEGDLYIVGRIKNVIISGGLNIYPEEIEEILINYRGIKEAIVIGEKHDVMGEVPVAKIVLDDDNVSVTDVIEYCKKMLDSHKVPRKIEICKKLDKTYNGKIKRNDK